jgi:hypothetical protein
MDRLGYYTHLRELYDEVLTWVPLEERHEYHLSSIENFIHYFDELRPEQKENAFEHIETYLNLVKDTFDGSYPADKKLEISKMLYRKFIQPLGLQYYYGIGFSAYTGWGCIYSILFLLLLVLFLAGLSIHWYFSALTIFILYNMWVLHKKARRKVFGFKY